MMTSKIGLFAAALSTALCSGAANAQRYEFELTGAVETWTVPTSGLYRIVAMGAQGGAGHDGKGNVGPGGLGAEIGGNFFLSAGTVLEIAVGGEGADAPKGGPNGGAGGGGTWVVRKADRAPLIIAGGAGGGGGYTSGGTLRGQGGSAMPDGNMGWHRGVGQGGLGGTYEFGGGGGGGFLSAGMDGANEKGNGGGGWPKLTGGSGAAPGGFGGGGGSGGGAGGGGGYSGGNGGNQSGGGAGWGGGGGMADEGISAIVLDDVWPGNGKVLIDFQPVIGW